MIKIPVHRIVGRSNKARGRSSAIVVAWAKVDNDRADLAKHFWLLLTGYAVRWKGGKRIFMHHDVVAKKRGFDVSHLNTDKLDNRRANLRSESRGDNMRNEADGPRITLKSNPYRGVTRDDKTRDLKNPWRGKVTVNGKTYQTARCATAEEARDLLVALKVKLGLRVREFPEVGNG